MNSVKLVFWSCWDMRHIINAPPWRSEEEQRGNWGHCMFHYPARRIRKQHETYGRQSQRSSENLCLWTLLDCNREDRSRPFHPSNLGSSILYSIFNIIFWWCCQKTYNLSANSTRASSSRQIITSHRLSVEVEAQETDCFLGTGGTKGTERRITYYDTIRAWKRKIRNCVPLIMRN